MPDFGIITICGSMRYYQLMLEAASALTQRGWIVLMPFATVNENTDTKEMLELMHFRKIDMSSAIVIVGTRTGESTNREREYAKSLHRVIYQYTPDNKGRLVQLIYRRETAMKLKESSNVSDD